MEWRMMLLATREVKFSAIIGDTTPLYMLMKENLRKTNQMAYDTIVEKEYIYKNGMEYPSDLDTYSQEESSSAEESKSEEIREIENATEQRDVIEIKKGNKAEEPENRLSKEASPSLEQHEDEYFVHLSNAESDDELENQQKFEQFTNTEKILKEIAEETKPTMISTPEQEKMVNSPNHNRYTQASLDQYYIFCIQQEPLHVSMILQFWHLTDLPFALRNLPANKPHKIQNWIEIWRIRANGAKSIHVTFTLRRETCPLVKINNFQLLQAEDAKYLGMHWDRRPTRKKQIFTSPSTSNKNSN
ncbi:hypothetical protein JTB14_004242 [Gonioctena quinquepunctata]|nr:hypothetical protein JTB14_004242 [Gonioctena quinquepunctata]